MGTSISKPTRAEQIVAGWLTLAEGIIMVLTLSYVQPIFTLDYRVACLIRRFNRNELY